MSGTVVSYPIPLYQNLPIQPQFYSPNRFVISAITLGVLTLVTTSIPNNFKLGQQIRLIIPPDCGCRELNEVSGIIVTLNTTSQFTLNVNSQNINPFVAPIGANQPQALPIGDINSGAINAQGIGNTAISIPGSFINVS